MSSLLINTGQKAHWVKTTHSPEHTRCTSGWHRFFYRCSRHRSDTAGWKQHTWLWSSGCCTQHTSYITHQHKSLCARTHSRCNYSEMMTSGLLLLHLWKSVNRLSGSRDSGGSRHAAPSNNTSITPLSAGHFFTQFLQRMFQLNPLMMSSYSCEAGRKTKNEKEPFNQCYSTRLCC